MKKNAADGGINRGLTHISCCSSSRLPKVQLSALKRRLFKW